MGWRIYENTDASLSDILPPESSAFQGSDTFPDSSTNGRPSVQMHESMGTALVQTTQEVDCCPFTNKSRHW